MTLYMLLAFLNGLCISVSRVLIGRLSLAVGPFKASFWSYVVGFVFVSVVLASIGGSIWTVSIHAPWFAYLGGFFGALYVVINSYAFTKMGATKTVIFVISGQMLSSIVIGYKSGALLSTLAQFFGVALIVIGIYLAKKPAVNDENVTSKRIKLC